MIEIGNIEVFNKSDVIMKKVKVYYEKHEGNSI